MEFFDVLITYTRRINKDVLANKIVEMAAKFVTLYDSKYNMEWISAHGGRLELKDNRLFEEQSILNLFMPDKNHEMMILWATMNSSNKENLWKRVKVISRI